MAALWKIRGRGGERLSSNVPEHSLMVSCTIGINRRWAVLTKAIVSFSQVLEAPPTLHEQC